MNNKQGKIIAVTGIDTDIGKTVATGLIARGVLEAGWSVITHKAVQTGCEGQSEDVNTHRKLMAISRQPVDYEGKTCSYLFSEPCSPHLAAKLAGAVIDPEKIATDAGGLAMQYDFVLLEGAGGLFVPLTKEQTLIDFLAAANWPVILVTSSRLGSINHTLASLEALQKRGMTLAGVVYNRFEDNDVRIAEDSLDVITSYLKQYGFLCPVLEMYGAEFYQREGACLPFSALCPYI